MSEVYSSSIIDTGVRRLKLLARHGKALMQAYSGQLLDEAGLSENTVQQLLTARIVWRSEEDGRLRISHKLRQLIAEMIADEQRRQTHADVAELLDGLRVLVNRYLEAQARGDYANMAQLKRLLTDAIDDFNSHFADAIDSLWQRLNSDFGFVSSLEDKIRENDRACKQVERLLVGLGIIDFNEWITLAGSHGFLRRLLVSRWQHQVSEHYSMLRVVQNRLVKLVIRFREQQAKAQLVRNTVRYLRANPAWQPGDYAQRSDVPDLANHVIPMPMQAYPEIQRDSHQELVLALFVHLPRRKEATALPETAKAVEMAEIEEVAPLQKAVKQATEAFYLAVADAREPVSALAWWQQHEYAWEADIWLFQVLAEYEGLPVDQRRCFRLQAHEEKAGTYNHLWLVRDYTVCLDRDRV